MQQGAEHPAIAAVAAETCCCQIRVLAQQPLQRREIAVMDRCDDADRERFVDAQRDHC